MPSEPVAIRGDGRSREIDWLRAYAILFVLLEHATLMLPYPTAWSGIVHVWYEGRNGVDLFFVVSGFVIGKSFVDAFDAERRTGPGPARRAVLAFYLKRLIRLGPAAAVWAAMIVAGSLMCQASQAFPPPSIAVGKMLAAFFYVYNISEAIHPTTVGHLYSLSTEMQFYLVFPLFLVAVTTRRRRLIALGAIFTLGLFDCPGFDTHPVFRFSGILCGIALYLMSETSRYAALRSRVPANPVAATLFTFAVLVALATVTPWIAVYSAFVSHVAALLSLLLVWAASYGRGCVSSLGLPTVLDWVGTRSYSIYLCHILVMLFGRALLFDYRVQDGTLRSLPLVPEGIVVGAALLGIGLCSELTFRALERSFQRKGTVIASRFQATTRPIEDRPLRPIAT